MLFSIFRHGLNFLASFFVLTLFTFGLANFFPEKLDFLFANQLDKSLLANHGNTYDLGDFNIFESYLHYIGQIFNGNLGLSSVRGSSVFNEFFIYFPATLELAVVAILFAMLLGIPLGILAAKNKNKWQDKAVVSSTLFGYSMPIFWWAMLLVLFFSLWLGVTPVASRIGFEYDILQVTGFMLIDTLLSNQPYSLEAFYSALHHLILPSIVLGTVPLAIITRSTRSSMISVLTEDYIRSARARGLSPFTVLWKHALRNAALPLITILGLQISTLITGSLITESIFAWPGAGKWLLEAVYRRDFPVIHGAILAIASFVILTHFLLDLLMTYSDPKLRRKS
jgi:dipeptide transport system permease protein